MSAYEQAIQLKPNLADACINLAAALQDLGRFDEALVKAEQALGIDPARAEAHVFRGMHLLLCGELEKGWPGSEWRQRTGSTAAI